MATRRTEYLGGTAVEEYRVEQLEAGLQNDVLFMQGIAKMKFIFSILICCSLMQAGVCSAGSWRVEQDGSGDFLALQPAVDAAASGDTILIGPGWYQELNWVDHYGTPIEVAAYWTDDRDLFFIGTSAAEVKIGPSSYVAYLDGPQGIFQEIGRAHV